MRFVVLPFRIAAWTARNGCQAIRIVGYLAALLSWLLLVIALAIIWALARPPRAPRAPRLPARARRID